MKLNSFKIFFKNKTRLNFIIILLFGLGAPLFLPLSSAAQETRQLEQAKLDNNQKKTEQRVALVIGNGNYKYVAKLANPVNDARDMQKALKELGFEVIYGEDQSEEDMKVLIKKFGKLLTKGGVGLFYYAGHGVQVAGKNYLIPVEANELNEDSIEVESVELERVLNAMKAAKNGFNIVILDACRNNPFFGDQRSLSGGLAGIDNPPTGTYIAYATAPGKVALDGKERNGLYTAELLKQMRIPNLKLEDVFKGVRAEVRKKSNDKQVPWESSSLEGNFIFTAASTILSREQSIWEAVKNTKDISVLKSYLAEFPQGAYISIAKLMLFKMENNSAPANQSPGSEKTINNDNTPIETQAWETVKDETNPQIFRLFLELYPKGENANKAQSRLDDLVWESVKLSWEKAKIQSYLNEFPQGKNAAEAKAKLDEIAWEAIKSSRDKAKFELYLKDFPQGKYILLAQLELKKLEVVASDASTDSSKGIRTNLIGMKFVLIPPGQFLMGSSNEELETAKRYSKSPLLLKDETPQQTVNIKDGFWLSRTEVTQEQWESVMGNNPSSSKSSNCPKCPVETVSWNDAKEFVRRLNARNDGYEYRLPTEAEWEYAARAGTKTAFGFGNSLNSNQANFNGAFPYGEDVKAIDKGRPIEVGNYEANAWGVYDMHGNVAEWCEDIYAENYIGFPNDGSANLKGDAKKRVIRGGSWIQIGASSRSANRDPFDSDLSASHIGFRVVAQIKKQ